MKRFEALCQVFSQWYRCGARFSMFIEVRTSKNGWQLAGQLHAPHFQLQDQSR
jgi:hypothetical protein